MAGVKAGYGSPAGDGRVMRLRFTTALQVFEAFPRAYEDVEQKPSTASPLAFVQLLEASQTPEDAVGFCAYLLPRREAVGWACECLRRMNPELTADSLRLIDIAEAWFQSPSEEGRKAALDAGMAAVSSGPAAWVALAAGWSGGSLIGEPNQPVPPPPHLTAQAVRASILTSLAVLPVKSRREQLTAAIQAVRRLIEQD